MKPKQLIRASKDLSIHINIISVLQVEVSLEYLPFG